MKQKTGKELKEKSGKESPYEAENRKRTKRKGQGHPFVDTVRKG